MRSGDDENDEKETFSQCTSSVLSFDFSRLANMNIEVVWILKEAASAAGVRIVKI
jgi:hypothetical protein